MHTINLLDQENTNTSRRAAAEFGDSKDGQIRSQLMQAHAVELRVLLKNRQYIHASSDIRDAAAYSADAATVVDFVCTAYQVTISSFVFSRY